MTLIPDGATLIVDAYPSIILNAPVMEPLLELLLGGPDTNEGFFSEFESDTGLDIESIEYAEMFLDIGALLSIGLGDEDQTDTDLPQMGVVLRGVFDGAKIIYSLSVAVEDGPGGPYEVEDYRGFNVYVDSAGEEESVSLAFPEADTFIFGTEDALKAMLDVAAGVAPSASGEGARMLDALGPRHFGLVMQLPPEAMEMAMAGEDGDLSMIGSMAPGALTASTTAMAMLAQDDSFTIRSMQLFDDEGSAAASKEFNEGTLLMLGSISGSPELRQLVSEIEVSQEGKTVSYDIALDEPSITAVLDFLQVFLQMGDGRPQN